MQHPRGMLSDSYIDFLGCSWRHKSVNHLYIYIILKYFIFLKRQGWLYWELFSTGENLWRHPILLEEYHPQGVESTALVNHSLLLGGFVSQDKLFLSILSSIPVLSAASLAWLEILTSPTFPQKIEISFWHTDLDTGCKVYAHQEVRASGCYS